MREKGIRVVIFLGVLLFVLIGCSEGDKGVEDTSNDILGSSDEIRDYIDLEQGIAFSKQEYFYDVDTEVEILSSKPGEIYYTLDGTTPDKTQTRYREAIRFIANRDTKANCIKAKAYFEDGTESETIIHTYFVGENVKERFDTLIFSITTDPYNLYDYEYGIFVEGKLREDYISENPGKEINPDSPANYNIRGREGEREVYLEIFEPDGTLVTEQAAGIRTYGGWSRARAQKSIKIFARKEYDEINNKLRYEFFPGLLSSKGEAIDTFKQLVLRNCGNDNGFAFIRDELFQTLAGQAGYDDYKAVRPAAMYVNGNYRGFFWLHEVYCDEYFEDHYGEYEGSFEIIEGGETYKKQDNENAEILQDYNSMYSYSSTDLTNDINYNKLCELMDVENYLSYYALNIYIDNEDWPHNNYKTYRYYAREGEEYREAPFDGKWRYLLHDMDYSTGIYGSSPLANTISKYVSQNGDIREVCPLFGQLMERADCREIFIEKTLDLINGAFTSENVSTVLEEMNASRLNELKNTYNSNLLEYWVSYDQLAGRLEELKSYINQRANYILWDYKEYFDLGEIYQLTVGPIDGCQFRINSFVTDGGFEGSYYSNYDTTISASLTKGKEMDYWLVNGSRVDGKELIITEHLIKDNKVEVELILK